MKIPLSVKLLLCVTLTCSCNVWSQTPAGTDIFLAEMNIDKGLIKLTKHNNITNRPGYDNQPFFLPDGQSLFYTSAITEEKTTQTDVIHYRVATGKAVNLTQSAESEYSPTLMPGGSHYSLIQVDATGKQKLWSYPLADGTKKMLLNEVEPVGYHAWIDPIEVLLFVLGEPHRLEVANINTGKSVAYDSDIGASLFRIPGTDVMSYSRSLTTDSSQAAQWQLMAFNPVTKQSSDLITLPKGAYYYAWTANAIALAAEGSKLMQWDYDSKKTVTWRQFADVSAHCPKGVTRLAVNPQNTLLAYVCDR